MTGKHVFGMVIGLFAIVSLIGSVGWSVTSSLFLLLWANNLSQDRTP